MKRGPDPKLIAEGIESDIQALRSALVSALSISRSLSEDSTSVATPDTKQVNSILSDIAVLVSNSQSTKEKRALLEKLNQLSQVFTGSATPENLTSLIPQEDAPTVWFERVPRLVVPIVDVRALMDAYSAESTPPTGLEGFLDTVFSSLSSDSIYDEALKKLRDQLIELNNRNLALELNLDIAEREVTHWRSLYLVTPQTIPVTQPQSPTSPARRKQRTIHVDAWKHAISKFIGSFDQFSMVRVLLHWRMYVQEEKRLRNSS
jgi:hypothetical protein